MKHRIEVDKNKCIGCGLCKRDCPTANIKLEDKKAKIITMECLYCGHCEAICPKNAIRLTGFDEKSEQYNEQVRLNSKELMNAIKTRRSIRDFKNEEIPKEIIEDIIEAGRFAPTGKNAQNVSFIVLEKDKKRFEKIAVSLFKKITKILKPFSKEVSRVKIDEDFFFKKAPAIILIISKDKVNGSLAAENMAFMAEAYGLGVLFSGFFATAVNNSRKLRKELGLKRKDRAVTALVLGYANVKYHRTTYKEPAKVRRV